MFLGKQLIFQSSQLLKLCMKECIFTSWNKFCKKNCVDVEKHDDEVSIISYTYEMIFKKMILTGCENVCIGNEG